MQLLDYDGAKMVSVDMDTAESSYCFLKERPNLDPTCEFKDLDINVKHSNSLVRVIEGQLPILHRRPIIIKRILKTKALTSSEKTINRDAKIHLQ